MINVEMSMKNKKISSDDIDEVAICLDDTGIDRLCDLLQRLKSCNAPDHVHLSTDGCGEEDLDRTLLEGSYVLVEQLRIAKISVGNTPQAK